jgi:tRNA G46 methylase TrmB
MDAHARTQQFSPFPDNDTEITRLMMLHLLLQEEIASFCPNLRERDDINTVLDVACGPGWWIFAMAQAHRDVDFVGIDRNCESHIDVQEKNASKGAHYVVN